MASVWKAEDPLLGRQVAVKLLSDDLARDPKARRRFLREARRYAQLDHPGVPAVYDAGECDGTAFIALTLIDGETLSALATRSPLPIDEALRVVVAAAEVLDHAHAQGFIHRDVTGRNIMVARDGRVFVLDFGLALAAEDSRITSTDTLLGTPSYLAPELTSGAKADYRSDVYALGVALFEAIAGALPYAGQRHEVVLNAALQGPVPSPRSYRPDIPPRLERIVLKAIARDPADRFQSARDLAAALVALRTGGEGEGGGPASSDSPPSSLTDDIRSHALTERGACLAIMPFESLGAAAGDTGEALANGLAESLSAALNRVPSVSVIPPSSARAAAAIVDPRQAARQLGANLLLRANLRRVGPHLRVTWSLVDPWRGAQVAGDTVQGDDASLFALEDALATSVRTALGYGEVVPRQPSGGPPRDPAAQERYLQALGYLQRRDNEASIDGAIGLLERLVSSEGESARVLAALGRAYLEKYRLSIDRLWESRAAAACHRALELDPQAPEVMVTLGDLHVAAGRYPEAIAEFERTLTLKPSAIEAILGLGRAREAAGQFDRAEGDYRRAISDHPDDWRPYSYLGAVLHRQGRYAEAVEPFRKVVQLTPDNPRGHANLGTAYYGLGRFEEAVVALRRSLEIQPTARALGNLGTVLFYMGRFGEAGDAYERAVALTPSDPLLWGSLGSASRFITGREGRVAEALDRAIALMREKLERNPRDGAAWGWLSGWLANRGQAREAIECVARALDLAHQDVSVMAMAGTVYNYLGDRPRALSCFRAAVKGGYGVERLRRDPELAPLRTDPEFIGILDGVAAGSGATPGRGTAGEGNPMT